MKRKRNAKRMDPRLWLLWGILLASLASLALVALFALLLQKQVVGFSAIRFINPGVKTVCAALAGFLGAKCAEKRRWLIGAGCGVGFIVLTTVCFSLLSGGFSLGAGNLADLLMCAFAGMFGGMLLSLGGH